MLPDRVSNPGPLTYESGALPIALRGPATDRWRPRHNHRDHRRNGLVVELGRQRFKIFGGKPTQHTKK